MPTFMDTNFIPYGSPTAPPAHHFHPQPSYPGPPPPQAPPSYDTAGTFSYGFQSPPPPYSGDPAPGYHQGYSPASPGPYVPPPAAPGPYIQPPMPPGGYGLYPDLAQLQQVPQAPSPYSSSGGTTSPPVPARPAPPPPGYGAPTTPDGRSPTQTCSFAHLKEGETPAGHVVQWRGGDGLQIFFLQQEGHVVSPKRPLIMSIYKRICSPGSPEGMVEVHGCWRLRLVAGTTPVLHTSPSCYTFMDTSTNPSRVVILQMSTQLTKKMSEDLLDLLTELTDLRNEDGGVVEKVTTGVATVYDDLTHKLNTVVKDTVPNAHKSTKWLRKGTGSLVRIGGNLVSRGIHLVADHIPANEKPQDESPAHAELLRCLKTYKKCVEENSITYVN
ncbi:hypothetical protein O3P69_012563 [Scylla paramamosain]|uniref:Uncharacterized protein n=1 Tax=Scylla paramamosain TaxID=85552 RepID=A0AAW0SJ47_SCYPA